MSDQHKIVKPGPYLLTQDVPNPKADRRVKHRWQDAPLFLKGWRFVVRERAYDGGDPFLVLASTEDSYVEQTIAINDERAVALAPFLEYDNDLIREIRFELSRDYIDLEDQAVAYVKQALRAGRLSREDFVKFARENHAAECAAYDAKEAQEAGQSAAGEP